MIEAAFTQEVAVKRSTVIEQFKGKPYYLHFVKQGETLFAISKAYNVEIEEIVADNPGVDKAMKTDQVLRIPYSEASIGQVTGKSVQQSVNQKDTTKYIAVKTQYLEHHVSKKETLYGISKQYGVTVDDIIKANPDMTELKNGMILRVPIVPVPVSRAQPSEVKPGIVEKLPIPDDGLLFVKQGQTIYSIGKQYDIQEEELLRLNPELAEGLKTGQTIRLKDSARKIESVTGVSREETKPEKAIAKTIESGPGRCAELSGEGKVFEVALLLPLNLEMADSIVSTPSDNLPALKNFKTYDLFQFYAGTMMALDTLEKAGCRANFHVYDADSENDTLKVKRVLRKSEMLDMDLIIGPVYARSFTIAARYASEHQIPIVNPLSRRSSIVENNISVYKVYPGEQAIGLKLASFIAKHYAGANIISVRNTLTDNAVMASVFADSLKGTSIHDLHFKEIIYQNEGFPGVNKAIDSQRKNIIVLFSTNRSLVPAFVSKLNAYTKSSDVALFGIPGWEDIEIETEFLLALDYHQAVTSCVDYSDAGIREFVTAFREKYGTQPLVEKEAFLGYDVTWYFMNALMRYGKDFGECLPYFYKPGLQNNFRFMQLSEHNGFENIDARIMHFDNFRWVED